MKAVEYLIAWDDNTWTTRVEHVTDSTDLEALAVTMSREAWARKAVLITVYNADVGQDADDPRPHVIYECGICCLYHPWTWDGDCREDVNRYGGPDEYAEKHGITEADVEVRSMEERVAADVADDADES